VLTKNGDVLNCPTLQSKDEVLIINQVFNIPITAVFGIAFIQAPDRGIGYNFKFKALKEINIKRSVSKAKTDCVCD